jgi:hypothetical protein
MDYNSLFSSDIPTTEPMEVDETKPTLPEFPKGNFGLNGATFGLGGSDLKPTGSYLPSDVSSLGQAERWQDTYNA